MKTLEVKNEAVFDVWAMESAHGLYFTLDSTDGGGTTGAFQPGTGPGTVKGQSFYARGIRVELDFGIDQATLANLDELDSLEVYRDIRVCVMQPAYGYDTTVDADPRLWPLTFLRRRKYTGTTETLDTEPWTPIDRLSRSADRSFRPNILVWKHYRIPDIKIIPSYMQAGDPDEYHPLAGVVREMKRSFWIPLNRRMTFHRSQIDQDTGDLTAASRLPIAQRPYMYIIGQKGYTVDTVLTPIVSWKATWYYYDDA